LILVVDFAWSQDSDRSNQSGEIMDTVVVGLCLCCTLLVAGSAWLFVFNRRVIQELKELRVRYMCAKHSEEQLNKQLLTASFAVQEEERRRISMDLHDEIGSSLTSLKFNIQALFKHRALRACEETEEVLYNDIYSTIEEIIKRNKDIVYDISPSLLEQFGLVVTINTLFKRVNHTYTVITRFTQEGEARTLTLNQELMLYRIIQECLSNAMKYSNRWRFQVHLSWKEDSAELQIMDETRFNLTPNTKGLGLSNIQNRILILGGTLKKDVTYSGNYYTIRVPYEHRKN
jgi:two-component system, NarL family, sensor kinase